MAQVMKLRWDGVRPEQYDAVRASVQWESDIPDGAIFHVAWFRDGGMTVVDVWETQEQFERFFQNRLVPAVEQAGIQGEPQMNWHDAHAYFNPAALQTTSAR